jgi:outer membrane protein assembly factor BamE
MMRHKIILVSLLLAACGGGIPHFSPYKMDVRQGNFVTQEMRDKLQLGMSKQQVRYVLGTPLLSDMFHGNRWDYVYSLAQRGKVVEHQAMTLYFEGDSLTRIDDAAMPVSVPAPVIEPVASSAVVAASAVSASDVGDAPAPVIITAPVVAVPSAEDAVKATVQGWAAAWAARDSKRYLAAYASSFKSAGLSHAAWLKQREQRIAKAHSIKVELSDVAVQTQDENHATATFKQDYSSGTHHDSTRKTLQLEKSGDAWLIVAEKIEK